MSLDGPTLPLPRSGSGPRGKLARGATLGRYIVLDRLGGGGMGVVYTAYDPELDRRVALKLLRPGRGEQNDSTGRTRLLREAQAMARLAHPNVIAVYDVGTVEDEVFVAMELVNGSTLSAWLKEKPRTVPEILEVFTQAGRGLGAAHEKGLVHRDFKPDNVLVGADGRVRVLDFGLARATRTAPENPGDAPISAALGAPSAPRLLSIRDELTKTGEVLGTPLFMAPEQFNEQPTDARTDQWSFCVALYRALYEQHPFGGSDIATLIDTVTSGKVQPEPPARRLPARLRAALLRGLSVDMANRFASMDELLAAVAPERSGARWWPAILAVLALFALAFVGLRELRKGASSVCAGADQKLGGVWDDARESAMAAAFSASRTPYAEAARRGTAKALDDYAGRWVAMHTDACMATRVRGEQSEELLDLRMECLSHRLDEMRALTGLLTRADAKVVEQSVQAAASLSDLAMCSDTASLKAAVRPPKDAAIRARVDAIRGRLDDARALEQAGKYPDQLLVATKVAEEAGSVGYRPLEAEARFALGQAQMKAGNFKAAEQSYAGATLAAEAGRHDEVAAQAWTELVSVQSRLNAFDRAHASSQHAEALLERLQGNERLLARVERALGNLSEAEGHYDDAVGHYKLALTSREAAVGAEHPEIAEILTILGRVLNGQGKRKEAAQAYRRALAIREAALGPDHPAVANSLSGIGFVLEAQGEYKEALEVMRRSLTIREKAFGPDHINVGHALLGVGNVLDDLGDLEGAIASYQRSLAIHERVYGPESGDVTDVLNNIGGTLAVQGKFPEALVYMERALAIREKVKGPDHPAVVTVLANVGDILNGLHRHREALASFERALAVGEKALGQEHPYIGDALTGIGVSYLALRQATRARAPLERALAVREKLGAAKIEIGDVSFHLARALWDTGGDRGRAVSLARRAREYIGGEQASRNKHDLAKIDAWLAVHGGLSKP